MSEWEVTNIYATPHEIATGLCSNPKIMNIIKTVFPTGGSPRNAKEFAQYVAELANEIHREVQSYDPQNPQNP